MGVWRFPQLEREVRTMKITKAKDLQEKWRAGLAICGEENGDLQWLGTTKQWDKSENKEVKGYGGGHIARYYPEMLEEHDCHHSRFGEDGCDCDIPIKV